MERISYTFDMMRSSWEVLKAEKQLVLFPLISGVCCVLVLLSFALPLRATAIPTAEQLHERTLLYYGLLYFLFYFVNYFIVIFFNSAVVACAILRMRGGEPTLSTGFHAALSRLPQIVGWALVAATVGMILRTLENLTRKRGSWVGQIGAGLLGMTWSVMTFLVVPILVVEKKGPFAALKESVALLKKTWGEQLVGGFSFGLVFLLLGLAASLAFPGLPDPAHRHAAGRAADRDRDDLPDRAVRRAIRAADHLSGGRLPVRPRRPRAERVRRGHSGFRDGLCAAVE